LSGRRGRAGLFSLGLLVGFLLLGYAALRVIELAPHGAPGVARPADAPAERPALGSWRAEVALGAARVRARLLPLHDEPALEEFRALALRERYALPEGAPWRLYLSLAEPLPPEAAETLVVTARVGAALVPFAELARAPAGPDPVHTLLAAAPAPLVAGQARPLVLWGVLSADDPAPVLELRAGEISGTGPLERDDELAAPRWYAGHALPEREERSPEEEIARLEVELARERTRRAEREQAFQEFTRILSELPVGQELGLTPEALAAAPREPTPEELAAEAEAAAARERAEELGRAVSVLMRLEGLRGLDLLEPGTLLDGPPSAIGPVLFRCLDERGALTGSVRAERLRLEASVSARTLTLVLEDGFESRGGERSAFPDGVRRITLSEVDPEPWLRDCPELFEPFDRTLVEDDGRWKLADVRRELNRLLALDTRPGWFRLHSLGGVRGTEFQDVQLEELEPEGKLARRIFADRMQLVLEDGHVVLELFDGAYVRGGEKTAFRDGRHRVVLAGVALEPWRAARLPGLSEPPEPSPDEAQRGELPRDPARPGR
jgi:hypothetical protein